jgi:glycosyltransferase involved in cell wall biosynthesis
MEPLRILYHHRTAARDGMRVHIEAIVAALRAQGHEVRVFGPVGEEGEAAGRASRLEKLAELLRRRLPATLVELLELAYNVPVYFALRAEVRTFRPDVMYERYNLFLLAGLWVRRRLGTPMLLEINAPLAAERAASGTLRLNALARLCERALWRGADVALPVTHVLAADVARARMGYQGVHVIPNGADPDPLTPPAAVAAARERLRLPSHALVLGFAGFVREWHKLDWALEALPGLPPDAHLVVVGDGPALADLRTRAEQLGIADRTRFVGRTAHSEMTAFLQTFDVALQPASTPYASPLKLFEYMALGLPILAPAQPNIGEVLVHDEHALLFQPGSRSSFVCALQRLCADAALRRRLGEGARKAVLQTPYTWTHNARRISVLARSLLKPEAAAEAAERRFASSAVGSD